MSQNKTFSDLFKETYADKLTELLSDSTIFFKTTESMIEQLSNRIFGPNTEERYYIDYKTNQIIKFPNKEAYEKYLETLKFNDNFEEFLLNEGKNIK